MNGKTIVKLIGLVMVVGLVATGCGGAVAQATQAPLSGLGGSGQTSPQVAAATEAQLFEGNRAADTASGGASDGLSEASGSGSTTGSESFPLPAPTMAAAPAEKSGAALSDGPAAAASGAGAPVAPPADTSSGPVLVAPSNPGSSLPPDQQFQQALTAGQVDDNHDFAAYLQYRTDYMRFNGAPVHDLDISERHAVRVRTNGGLPVLDALVTVYDGQTRIASVMTTASGVAYFFPQAAQTRSQAQSYNVTVEKDQASKSFTLTRQNRDDVWDVTLPVQASQAPVQLDVLFLLDSTGSMGDEIQQLKDNLLSISAQVGALPSHPDVHFGLVTYRDRGDQYIVRMADFTPNVQEFQSVLSQVQAAGGGDEPESLNEAMHDAISGQLHWRMDSHTVRLVFLVSDAAPHLDYPQDFDYASEMVNAAAMGIKIEPIAASGANDQAEYIFRQIGQYTGGQFIFLTYASTPQSSGEPGTTHHVQEGSYTSQDLDALVVRLIQQELAQLSAAPGQQ
jgi:von Willebrand factor type A domain